MWAILREDSQRSGGEDEQGGTGWVAELHHFGAVVSGTPKKRSLAPANKNGALPGRNAPLS
jgi:hypothetical protein